MVRIVLGGPAHPAIDGTEIAFAPLNEHPHRYVFTVFAVSQETLPVEADRIGRGRQPFTRRIVME
jgi:phosphatidylethanolamine-binding protein (PEBP) family uncharacterized protein